MKKFLLLISLLALNAAVQAKLPAPSEEAKAKAAEVAAKTAHGDKVAAYQLCKSREKVATHYYKTNGKGKAAPTATPACVDPGVYKPLDSAVTASPAAAPAAVKPAAAVIVKKG